MSFTREILEMEITKRGLYPDDSGNITWGNEELMKFLGDDTLSKKGNSTWLEHFIQSMGTVMLCRPVSKETQLFRDLRDPMVNEYYIAEDKLNGFRCVLGYSPETGFELFSRNESVETYLNGSFTEQTLFIKDGIVKTPKDFINKMDARFVLDCEVTIESDRGIEDQVYSNVEDYIQSVLGSGADKAKEHQLNGHRLVFNAFDVIYFERGAKTNNTPKYSYKYEKVEVTDEVVTWVDSKFSDFLETAGFYDKKKKDGKISITKGIYEYLYSLKDVNQYDLRPYPFHKRAAVRKSLVEKLNSIGIPIKEVTTEQVNKSIFLDEIKSKDGEGIILKNIYGPYVSAMRSSRGHRSIIKVKQSVSEMLNEDVSSNKDFDVFITGINKPISKNVKDMIGALNCSIYINDDGEVREHQIASVSGISHEWKRKLALIDEDGNISLNPEYLHKVISIDGLALTGRNLKFQHAKVKGELEFKAKNPTDCTWDIEELNQMVITRGK